jgi:DNA-binding response OmpR family regulator
MAKFCAHCGQTLPGLDEKATLFSGKLSIHPGKMEWDGGRCILTMLETQVAMAVARCHPRPASTEFTMDFLENNHAIKFKAEDPKIVQVIICRIRRKMLDAKCPFRIETVWGQGKVFAEGGPTAPFRAVLDLPRGRRAKEHHGPRC